MTQEDKCLLAIKKGFLYFENTGEIITPTGVVASKKSVNGYIMLTIRDKKKPYYLYGHQFAWYIKNKRTAKLIDHKNRIKTDNKINNLRESTKQINALNNNASGSYKCKKTGRFESLIMINGKKIYLGKFDTKKEAEENYRNFKNKKIEELCN